MLTFHLDCNSCFLTTCTFFLQFLACLLFWNTILSLSLSRSCCNKQSSPQHSSSSISFDFSCYRSWLCNLPAVSGREVGTRWTSRSSQDHMKARQLFTHIFTFTQFGVAINHSMEVGGSQRTRREPMQTQGDHASSAQREMTELTTAPCHPSLQDE